MEIENLWEARDMHMPQYEIDLKRLEDNSEISWQISGRDTSDNYGEHIVHLTREDLKKLGEIIEKELHRSRTCSHCNTLINEAYGEYCVVCGQAIVISQEPRGKRYATDATVPSIWQWEERPLNCPTCNILLRQSRHQNGEKYFCPNYHGTLYVIQFDDKKMWGWYSLL